MKVDITEVGAAVTLTKDQFRVHFLEEGNGSFDFLTEECPAVDNFEYNGHMGPYIFFWCEAKKFEKAKAQVLKAAQRWMAENSSRLP